MLEIFCREQFGYDAAQVAEAFGEEDDLDPDREVAVISTVHFLAGLIVDGSIPSFSRPVGGGDPIRIPSGHWEIDNFIIRFATSGYDPRDWANGNAIPTHWIFVDEEAVGKFLTDWDALVSARSDLSNDNPDGLPLRLTAEAPGPIIRKPEVLALTGMSGSTLYAKIGRGEFPKQIKLGERMSGWRENDVRKWMSDRT